MSFYVNTLGSFEQQVVNNASPRKTNLDKSNPNVMFTFEEMMCLHQRDLSDAELAVLLNKPEEEITLQREEMGIKYAGR